MQDYNNINDLILKAIDRVFIESDDDLEEILKKQLGKRGVIYTQLLENYAKTTKWRNRFKEFHKWTFFWLVAFAGGVIVYYICRIMNKILDSKSIDEFIKTVPVIITAFVSLLSTVIGIPMTITKFLFNAKEDDNITDTIHHTQDHDNEEASFLLKKDADPQNKNKKNDDLSQLNFYISKEKQDNNDSKH